MREETGKAVWYDDSLEEQSEKKNKKCTEVVEKRTACKKVFENEDHSFTAAVYPCAVHFQEKGKWKEIDNTLEEEIAPFASRINGAVTSNGTSPFSLKNRTL